MNYVVIRSEKKAVLGPLRERTPSPWVWDGMGLARRGYLIRGGSHRAIRLLHGRELMEVPGRKWSKLKRAFVRLSQEMCCGLGDVRCGRRSWCNSFNFMHVELVSLVPKDNVLPPPPDMRGSLLLRC